MRLLKCDNQQQAEIECFTFKPVEEENKLVYLIQKKARQKKKSLVKYDK